MTRPGLRRGASLVASLFGLGHVPMAAGTVASAVAVVSGALILPAGSAAFAASVAAASLLGWVATAYSGAAATDPGWIVIDELAGQWLAMVTLPRPSAIGLVAAFVLFRVLDITKPGPIGWLDRRHDAVGVMGDDLMAGAIAALMLGAAVWRWPHWLG